MEGTLMTYQYEKNEGLEFTNEQGFRERFCKTCKWREICEAWEFETGCFLTLYSNHVRGKPSQLFIGEGSMKQEGVYRCANYIPKEEDDKEEDDEDDDWGDDDCYEDLWSIF